MGILAHQVEDAIRDCPWIEEVGIVVTGGASGVDEHARTWALANGRASIVFPAHWRLYGRRAGPIRNDLMVRFADSVIALPGPESRGTWDTVRKGRRMGKKVWVWTPTPPHGRNRGKTP